MGRRDGCGVRTGAGAQNLRRVVGVAYPLPHEEEGTDEGTDHRVAKSVGLNTEDEGPLGVSFGAQGPQGTNRRCTDRKSVV